MFCKECGRKTTETICPYCRQHDNIEFIDFNIKYSNCSWFKAGLMQIFLGAFGVGRFYLGYKKIGILQILVSLLTFGVGGFFWGFIDGIRILSGKVKYDAKSALLI